MKFSALFLLLLIVLCSNSHAQTSTNRVLLDDKDSLEFAMPKPPIYDYYHNLFANLGTNVINYELPPTVEIDRKTYISKYTADYMVTFTPRPEILTSARPRPRVSTEMIFTVQLIDKQHVQLAAYQRLIGLYAVRYESVTTKFSLENGVLNLNFAGDFSVDKNNCDYNLIFTQGGRFTDYDAFGLYEAKQNLCKTYPQQLAQISPDSVPNQKKYDVSINLKLQEVSRNDYKKIETELEDSQRPFLQQYAKYARNRELRQLKAEAFLVKNYREALRLSALLRSENQRESITEQWVAEYINDYSFDVQCYLGLKDNRKIVETFMKRFYFVEGAEDLAKRGIIFGGDLNNRKIFLDALTAIWGAKRANHELAKLYKNLKEVVAEKQTNYEFTFLNQRYKFFPRDATLQNHPIRSLAFQSDLNERFGGSMGEISGTLDGEPFNWKIALPDVSVVNVYESMFSIRDTALLKIGNKYYIPFGYAYESLANVTNFVTVLFDPNAKTNDSQEVFIQIRFDKNGNAASDASDVFVNNAYNNDEKCKISITKNENGEVNGAVKGVLKSVTNPKATRKIDLQFRMKLYEVVFPN